jgi:tetratricopeptide (TPR) repeat protein
VILYYLKQAFWPDPLCLDWYWMKAKYWWQIYPQAVGVTALLGLTGLAFWKRPAIGFLGVWFFLILAPTSSIVPIADLMFEHRMYLPLAGLIVLLVLGTHWVLQRIAARRTAAIGLFLAFFIVCALCARTLARNADYHNGLAMWSKTVQTAPWNPRACTNVAIAYLKQGKKQEAIDATARALGIDPGYADAYRHLAKGLADLKDWPAAADAYGKALSLVLSGQAREAFNLSAESKELREKYGNNTFGQWMPMIGCMSAIGTPCMRKSPACAASTRNKVVSPAFAVTVMVSTHSNTFSSTCSPRVRSPTSTLGATVLRKDCGAPGFSSERSLTS